jgi:spermidine/putrescine transport system permease protein
MPVKIYANARGAPTPALNALASVMLFATILAVTIAFLILRIARRARGERGSALGDFAQLRV